MWLTVAAARKPNSTELMAEYQGVRFRSNVTKYFVCTYDEFEINEPLTFGAALESCNKNGKTLLAYPGEQDLIKIYNKRKEEHFSQYTMVSMWTGFKAINSTHFQHIDTVRFWSDQD